MKTIIATAAVLGLSISVAAACPFNRSVSAETEAKTGDMSVASTTSGVQADAPMSSALDRQDGEIIVARTDRALDE